MKRVKKFVLAAAFIVGGTSFASAQSYNTALGLRFGDLGDAALNVKHFLGGTGAIEATLGGGRHHLFLEGLYEWNFGFPGAEGLYWYLGAGANATTWGDGHNHNNSYYDNSGGFYLAARGVIGLDYTFPFPLNLAIHTGPRIGIVKDFGYAGWGGSLAIRYAF